MRSWNWPRVGLLASAGLGILGVWWCLTHRAHQQPQPAAIITPVPVPEAVPEPRALVGKWRSRHGDDTVLEVTDGMLLIHAGERVVRIGYDAHSRYAPDLAAWLADTSGSPVSSGWPSRPFDFLLQLRITGSELSLTGIPDFVPTTSNWMGIHTPADGVLRFKRLSG
jgi:hypothetical protein